MLFPFINKGFEFKKYEEMLRLSRKCLKVTNQFPG